MVKQIPIWFIQAVSWSRLKIKVVNAFNKIKSVFMLTHEYVYIVKFISEYANTSICVYAVS